jgi:orotate phosphoribosyltransferase
MSENFVNVSRTLLSVPGLFRSISDNPAILSCREVGPYYIDNRKLYSFPKKRTAVAIDMNELIKKNVEVTDIDKLTTTETAGIPICSLVGHYLGIGTSYVKKKAKAYGLGRNIEGVIENGEYVVGVDDLTTKGTNAKIAIDTVRDKGAKIDKYFVIFDRRQGATEFLADLNVELHSLSHMSPQFMDVVLEMGLIKEDEMKVFGRYSENPTEWSKNFILENPDYLKEKIANVVKNGVIEDKAPLEVLTVGHPELKENFEPEVRGWLAELGVKQELPEFNYQPHAED